MRPFFGQFIAHDITADRSPLGHRADPAQVRNFRVPKANLEGVYGAGPVGSPYLYDKDDPAKLLLSPMGSDVPRNHEGIALIGDPRNDVHLFTSQMSVAFIKLHNRLVDRLRHDEVAEQHIFEQARRAASWHYQHVILREFLPGLVGAQLTAELLDSGPQLYRVERDPYEHFGPRPVFPDLMGFGPVPAEHTVDWALQIDVEGHALCVASQPRSAARPSRRPCLR